MRVAVLGAGIQGCCLALELASRGVQVDLYDRNQQPFVQASLLNEAKIHLGFFYANEPSMRTARLVMQGALTFQPYLRNLLGDAVDSLPVSQPYIYAVHRESLLPVDAIAAHLYRTSALIGEAALPRDYFGVDPARLIAPVEGFEEVFDTTKIVAAFQTPEVGISAAALGLLVRERLTRVANVRCIMGATVSAARPCPSSAGVEFDLDGARHTEGYDHVINALWDGRLAVDATAGVHYERRWLFRTRYNLHLPAGVSMPSIPSVSFVLGAFGDIVQYDGGESYLSWYSAGLRAVSDGLNPAPFPPVLEGAEADHVRRTTLDALTDLMPGLCALPPELIDDAAVDGGIIFAWGETDITDPDSRLHSRHEIGPRSYGRYHSVDTGKFTTAPLFARQLADTIVGD